MDAPVYQCSILRGKCVRQLQIIVYVGPISGTSHDPVPTPPPNPGYTTVLLQSSDQEVVNGFD